MDLLLERGRTRDGVVIVNIVPRVARGKAFLGFVVAAQHDQCVVAAAELVDERVDVAIERLHRF